MGRAPRTKETLPDFLKWRRVTRPPLVFRGLTGSQRTPGFWGITRVVPPHPGGIHSIEFLGHEIFMMGWHGEAPQPICLYADSGFSGYPYGQQVSRPFRLIPDDVPRLTSVSPLYFQHVPPMAPFILFLEEYGPVHKDVQIVTRSGRVAQPPPVDRPFVGIDARDEI